MHSVYEHHGKPGNEEPRSHQGSEPGVNQPCPMALLQSIVRQRRGIKTAWKPLSSRGKCFAARTAELSKHVASNTPPYTHGNF
eukprot:361794-Chlamydomonas_euryale.AAC.7